MSRKPYNMKTQSNEYETYRVYKQPGIEDMADLSLEERSYVEHKVTNQAKSSVTAWLLWFFLAGLGGHRFYFGKIGSGFGMIAVTLFLSSWMFGIPSIIWVIYDAFQINKWLEQSREYVREDAVRTVLLMRK